MLTQHKKSLKVWGTVCEKCAPGFVKSNLLKTMGITEVVFLTMEDVETAEIPSFLERTSKNAEQVQIQHQ